MRAINQTENTYDQGLIYRGARGGKHLPLWQRGMEGDLPVCVRNPPWPPFVKGGNY